MADMAQGSSKKNSSDKNSLGKKPTGDDLEQNNPTSITKSLMTAFKPVNIFFSNFHVFVYQVSRGILGGTLIGGTEVCLLTVEGRKSKKLRTVALVYIRDGEDVILVASQNGLDADPQWYKNLLVNPKVDIQLGKIERQMVAHAVDIKAKDTLWPVIIKEYPGFEKYQLRTNREFPIVICKPKKIGPSNPALRRKEAALA